MHEEDANYEESMHLWEERLGMRTTWRMRLAIWWNKNIVGTGPDEYSRLDRMDGLE